jgi:hypothetical protein
MTTPYVTADQIAAALGVTFTPEQEAQADAVAAAVTSYIDGYTGRSWQGTSPVSGELRPVVVPGPADTYGAVARCYLDHTPVSAVDAVGLRSTTPNAEPSPLDAAAYELVDAVAGVLLLPGYGYGALAPWSVAPALAVVDYTYADAVPADITLAATMIASGVMQQSMTIQAGSSVIAANPSLAGVQSISVGQNDVNVTLSKSATAGAGMSSAAGSSWAAPGSAVADILNSYKRPVLA